MAVTIVRFRRIAGCMVVGIPAGILKATRLKEGDQLMVQADGRSRLVIEKAGGLTTTTKAKGKK